MIEDFEIFGDYREKADWNRVWTAGQKFSSLSAMTGIQESEF